MLSENLSKRRLYQKRSNNLTDSSSFIPTSTSRTDPSRTGEDKEVEVLEEVKCGYYDLVWTISDIL